MILVKAQRSVLRPLGAQRSFPLPEAAVPFVAAIVAAFVFFIAAVGAASLYARDPEEK